MSYSALSLKALAVFLIFPAHFLTENLLQNSVDDSWTDTNLNRVSVIQFQEETKPEEEDDEAAAERRVRKCFCVQYVHV